MGNIAIFMSYDSMNDIQWNVKNQSKYDQTYAIIQIFVKIRTNDKIQSKYAFIGPVKTVLSCSESQKRVEINLGMEKLVKQKI